MTGIRVLIVDDSVVVRRVLTELLSSDPELEVVGAAPNGRAGLEKANQLDPDVVILDVEMPELDGIQTLRELRRTNRRAAVIMFSTLTERGAAATLEALAAGASDYVTKPAGAAGLAEASARLRTELIPRIKHLARRRPPAGREAAAGSPVPPARPPIVGAAATRPAGSLPRRSADKVEVVAIGVSTGGPNALAELLPALPAGFPVPVLVVQHMPPTFTRLLAERLDRVSSLAVCEAETGMPIKPGHVYVAPGDHHLVVERTGGSVVTRINQDPPENSCRPSVDVLFRSVAEVYGAHALGVVMTGMGQDGLRGSQVLVERGAMVLAQDEATSVVWGMPGYVVRAGVADAVLPLGALAGEIVKRVLRTTPAVVAGAGGTRR